MSEPVGERPRMPDYGVDTAEWEPLPWSWAAERLAAGRNYWVVTASAAGRPHALPVWGVWADEEHHFAFSCGPRSRKAANLRANPQATGTTESTVEVVSLEGAPPRSRATAASSGSSATSPSTSRSLRVSRPTSSARTWWSSSRPTGR